MKTDREDAEGTEQEERSFEDALKRLEEIVQAMEAGDLKLEQMMAYFEEGMKLVELCNRKLQEVQEKVEILVKKGEELTTEEFRPEGDES
ncbi:MAG: exodeoxyribonuclease VII small subunit [Verrucomicrobia bacterium]|nr:MAG: exodeoxyribonuclease VII small subunit [Verrucomicrobiota bacterium]